MPARHYLFPENGNPLRIPHRVLTGLIRDTDSLPQFANTKQRVLSAYLEMEDRKPVRIWRTETGVWSFDEDGGIGDSLRRAMALAMDSLPTPERTGTVVALRPHVSRDRLKREHRWEPTNAEIDRIVADIWPKKSSDRLKVLKGTSEPRPSLTYDAKFALEKCAENFWKIGMEIEGLSEPSLKAFSYEARNRAKEDGEYAPLYLALGEIADWNREVLVRHRTGKGAWYAVLEVLSGNAKSKEVVATYSELCEGRKRASEAARMLLAKHADAVTEQSTIGVEIMTDLEWKHQGYPD